MTADVNMNVRRSTSSLFLRGAEKIIFGSDFPILSPKRILNEMKNLKEQDLMNITEKNIKNILNLN